MNVQTELPRNLVATSLKIADALYAAHDQNYLAYLQGQFASLAVANTTWNTHHAGREIKIITTGIADTPGGIEAFSIDQGVPVDRFQHMPHELPHFVTATNDIELNVATLQLPLDPALPAVHGLDAFLRRQLGVADSFTHKRSIDLRALQWGSGVVAADRTVTYVPGVEQPIRHEQMVAVASEGHAGEAFRFAISIDMLAGQPTGARYEKGGRRASEMVPVPVTDEALRDAATMAHIIIDLAKGYGLQRYVELGYNMASANAPGGDQVPR